MNLGVNKIVDAGSRVLHERFQVAVARFKGSTFKG